VNEFGGEGKEKAIEILNEVNSRLPLLSEANYVTISRVESLLEDSLQVKISDGAKIKAVQRGIDKRAPFHISKNSTADAVIIEQFSEFTSTHDSDGSVFTFVTHNHNDFSSKDHREPHEDFSDIFDKDNVHYFNNVYSAIAFVDGQVLEGIQFEHDFTEETRGLQEILSAMDELVDKVWYNRHHNLRYLIEKGRESVNPEIWKGALAAAKKVEERYGKEKLGPWDDFEWGMITGKLSALRWVLGDEWDMLDT
jgi:hypothetical protein